MSFTVATADFERGTNGATISASDAGSRTAWDQVDIGGSGSVAAYGTTYAAHGTKGAHLKLATSGTTALHWGLGAGGTEQWGRCYIKPLTYPAGTTSLLRFFNGGSEVYLITWNPSGQLTIGGSTFTNAMPLNQWSRVEWHLLHNTSTGIADFRLYQDADSTIPTELKQRTGQNTGSTCNALVIGNSGTPDATYEIAFDQAVAGAAALPGPYPVSTSAPTIAGPTTLASTLYCDPGTWNSGAQYTLTYQWKRNGVNIGGATGSSYVIVEADTLAAVGCTVTATGLVATNETASRASSNTITVSGPPPVTSGSFGCRSLSRELLDIVVALPTATELDSVDCE